MQVGFIGIGGMGRHMSRRILEAGHALTVHDLNPEAAAPLLAQGASWAGSPREVAAACRVVFSSLPTPGSVEEVVYGDDGLKAGWKPGDIYVDMSTNSPSLIRRIARDAKSLGVTVLDAPVSGGTVGAEQGTLTIMVGGDPKATRKIEGILKAMGQNIFPVGEAGCGNVAKLVNNLISLACNSISAAGFVLGVKGGLQPQVLWDIVSRSTGDNWCLEQYPETTFRGRFEPGFKITLAYKDIGLALDLGEEYAVPLPVGQAVRQDLEAAIAAGLGDKGVDAVILPLEAATGVKVRLPEKAND